MGFGISLGLLYRNPIMLATIQISFIIDNFKFRVAAEAGTFEAESCLSSTLNNLNSLEVDINTQVVRNYSARVRGDSGTVEGFESIVSGIKSLRDSDLINTTTLALFPSGVKAGKTYSLLPENPNGDFTVVRNTTATRVNRAGFIEEVAANVPRLNYLTVGGNPFLLDEPQATNLILRSNEFNFGNWSKVSFNGSSTLIVNNVISPENILNASTITPPQITSPTERNNRFYQQVSTPTNLSFTFSIFVKSIVAGVNFKLIHIGFQTDNNIKEVAYVTTTDWVRYEITSNTASSLGARANISFENTIQIYGSQFESSLNSTSYIPTGGAAVTRNADIITRTPPAETLKITTTFSDNTTQVLTTIPATYTTPEGIIKSIIMSSTV